MSWCGRRSEAIGNSRSISGTTASRTAAHRSILELQQPVRVAGAELRHVGGSQRDLVQEIAATRVRCIWVVDREHDAVDAEGLERGDKRRLAEDTTGGDPDLLDDGGARLALEVIHIGDRHLVE